MKPGDIVKVYQKPFTREDYEGKARIVRLLSRRPQVSGGVHFYPCVVNFPEDGPDQVVTRLVGEQEYSGRRSGQGDTPPGSGPDLNLETPDD